jgi:lipoprotein-releasing system ATP-binding protein
MSKDADFILQMRGVSCRRGDLWFAEAILSITPASLHFLRGNGGASLLLRVATLLETPDIGIVELAGEAVREIDDASRAAIRSRLFGFVFDAPYLLPEMSVAENIAMPLFKVLNLDAAEARECTEATLHFAGLEPLATTRAGELSWFDQQRVALARAVAHQPALLALEHPDANLSADDSAELMRLVRRVRRELGISVLALCTHAVEPQPDERLVSVSDGCVREESGAMHGTPEQQS